MSSPDNELKNILGGVFADAGEAHYEYVTVEHLLLGILADADVVRLLEACDVDVALLRQELETFIREHTPKRESGEKQNTVPTLAVQRIFSRASFHSMNLGKNTFSSIDVLVAIFQEEESPAVHLLHKQGLERLDVVNWISHGSKLTTDGLPRHRQGEGKNKKDKKEALVEKFCLNLNEEAKAGRLDPLIGRKRELERLMQVLCRRNKNNPLLVGEAGVGKTAIAAGLAQRIVQGEVPEALKDRVLYSLDMGGLLAGTRYRGDFEERFKSLMQTLSERGNAILLIDEIHAIIGAGAVSGGVMDAANMIKPVLVSRQISCIGATTFTEYRHIFERDRALTRRFQKIEIPEPNLADSYQILRGLRSGFEEHHGLQYSDAALRAAADLSYRHINERFLPDKAIDVVDEAGASLRLSSRQRRRVGVSDVEQVVAKMAQIPARSVAATDRGQLQHLESNLKLKVFGQDEAIHSLASAVKMSRAGLKSGDKPVGCYLFAGPTGVGKTELCKQLAETLGVQLLRFDMSEYQERHTVSRLIGAPPGYVGFDQGGLLTEAVTRNPWSVVLLDEIEKAHPEVYNLLLQVMDRGFLTDNNGRQADFRNVILVMTSNVGAMDMARRSVGFRVQDHQSDTMIAIERHFTPEFRNRLDAIILFSGLNDSVRLAIVDKFLAELQAQLDEKHVRLKISAEVRKWLADKGCDPKMGARPLARLLADRIKQPLSELLLFGELSGGGTVQVRLKNGEPQLQTTARREEKSPGKSARKLSGAAAESE